MARVFLLFAAGAGAIAAVVAADRIGKGIRTAPRDAMISAATPTEHLGRAFGVHRTLDTIGAALGPADRVRGPVVDPGRLPHGDGRLARLRPGRGRAARPARARTTPGPPAERRRTEPTAAAFRWKDLTDRRLTRLLVVAGRLGLLTVGDGFIYLALLDRGGFGAEWFPLLYVGTNVAYLALAIPIGRLADRVGRARVLVAGHLALAGAYPCATVPSREASRRPSARCSCSAPSTPPPTA